MITTNQIDMLIDSLEGLPYKPEEHLYKWLKDLSAEIKRSKTFAVQVAFVKSPSIKDMLEESN